MVKNQVISLEYAQKLDKHVKNVHSLFWWVKIREDYELMTYEQIVEKFHMKMIGTEVEAYAAFNVAELGELLPEHLTFFEDGGLMYYYFTSDKGLHNWSAYYAAGSKLKHFQKDKSEAIVRAKLLLTLFENNLMEKIDGKS